MITKAKTRKIALVKLMLLLPISFILFLSFSCSKNDETVWNAMEGVIRIPDDKIESHADFPGGSSEMWKFINGRIKIPQELIEKNTCGKLAVRFEVDVNGAIENIRIAQSKEIGKEWKKGKLGYGCDDEAIRIISKMPKWKPAIAYGRPVKLTQSLILFFGTKEMEAKWNELKENQPTDTIIIDAKPATYDYGSVDKEPQIDMTTISKAIYYPDEAREKGIEGTVLLRVLLKKTGEVGKVLIEWSDNHIFNDAAMNAVKDLKVIPAKKDGKNIDMWVSIPINFKLK